MRYDEKKEKGNKKGHSIIDSRRRIPQSFLRWICVRAAEENICYENNGPSVRFDWDKTRIYLVSTPPAIVPRPKNSSSNVCNGGRIKTSCLAGNLLKIQPRDCIYCSVFPNLLKGSPREKRICSNGICSKCLVYLRSLIFFFSHPLPPFLIVITTFISIFPSGKYFILMDHQIISKLFFLSQIYSTSSVMVER